MRMDLTTLRIFLAVCDSGSITKAAEHEHIAPSAVSKRIHDLELDLDVPLLYRKARGVVPTAAGLALAAHLRSLFDSFDQLAADLGRFTSGTRGEVRIYANSSAAIQYLPGEIVRFSEAYPEVRVILREESSPNVVQALFDGAADIGIFASNMILPPGITVLPYHEHKLVVLLPANHPLAKRRSIDFEKMLGTEYISFRKGSSLQALLESIAKQQGTTLNTRIEVTTFEAGVRMVEAGLGFTVLPESVVASYSSDLKVRSVPLTNSWAWRGLVLGVKDEQKLTASARLMLEHLRADH